jgi:hypothetical protein
VLVTSKRSDCRSGTIAGASILAIETAALDDQEQRAVDRHRPVRA